MIARDDMGMGNAQPYPTRDVYVVRVTASANQAVADGLMGETITP